MPEFLQEKKNTSLTIQEKWKKSITEDQIPHHYPRTLHFHNSLQFNMFGTGERSLSKQDQIQFSELTCSVRLRYSWAFMIISAGAKNTNELPWTNGSRVPKQEWRIVVIPEISSRVEITVAVSFCHFGKNTWLSTHAHSDFIKSWKKTWCPVSSSTFSVRTKKWHKKDAYIRSTHSRYNDQGYENNWPNQRQIMLKSIIH